MPGFRARGGQAANRVEQCEHNVWNTLNKKRAGGWDEQRSPQPTPATNEMLFYGDIKLRTEHILPFQGSTLSININVTRGEHN